MCLSHVGRLRFGALLALAAGCATARPVLDLSSTGERSGYLRTGRYAEAVQLCHDFARMYAEARCDEIGRTLQGRAIVALTLARAHDLPVILVEGGIHAGEIEGKDAGFAFARDLLTGKVAPGALDAVQLVFVPVINPDGHERFGPNHRPNQRGPVEMGFRTNGARLNLNRDFVKVDAPETRAIIGLMRRHDPVLFVDLHTTDGAKFEHDISVGVSPFAPRADGLDELARSLSARMQQRLTQLGNLPVAFYPSFRDPQDPASGFVQGEAPPRFSHYYAAARGRMGMLVETHSWRTYQERVRSTYHTLQALLEVAARDAATWRTASDEASTASAALGGTAVDLLWEPTATSHPIEFRGYAYERRPSPVSGGTWLWYDETKPQVWTVPLFDELTAAVTVVAPRAGYIVDGGYAATIAPMLDVHGIRYEAVAGTPVMPLEVFRATATQFSPSIEGRQRAQVTGAWAPETRALDAGALFVPIAQPLGRLVLHVFEPTLPDSLTAWGAFNTAFEPKEYMEDYVAEEQARAMLAADSTLQAQFDAALAADPELAKSAEARLAWFYRRHPAWDERLNLVPVYRAATPPP